LRTHVAIMPPIPGMVHWHSLIARHAKTIRSLLHKGLSALDKSVAGQARALEPVLVRNTPKQPLHPLARIRQTQSRWYSTTRRAVDGARSFSSIAAGGQRGVKYDKSAFPTSVIGSRVQSSTGRAPFASTLRPNLTGGTLGRTAGGYTLGSGRIGGARHFSHGPANPAHVVHNVSQAVRAFFISGHKAQFDGVSPTGEKRFVAVSTLQEETGRKMRSLPKTTPGSWIDFQINPTITALTCLNSVVGYNASDSSAMATHINSDGLIEALSTDFSRALKELAAIQNDIKRLASLGDLLITHEGTCLRVHFPGCDATTVERLCEELNVRRGVIHEDDAFNNFVGAEMALLFPMAPSESGSVTDESDGGYYYEKSLGRRQIRMDDMYTATLSEHYSTHSEDGFEDILAGENPWLSSSSSPSGFQSVRSGSALDVDEHSPLEYQGFEGIYRFIEELDSVRR